MELVPVEKIFGNMPVYEQKKTGKRQLFVTDPTKTILEPGWKFDPNTGHPCRPATVMDVLRLNGYKAWATLDGAWCISREYDFNLDAELWVIVPGPMNPHQIYFHGKTARVTDMTLTMERAMEKGISRLTAELPPELVQ